MIKFDIDPTEGSIVKGVILLSIPMMLEMVSQTLFNLTDTFFVSRIHYQAIGALVSSSMILMLVVSLGIGVATSGGIFIATYVGAKNRKLARDYFSNAMILSLIIAVLLSTTGLLFLRGIIGFIGLKGMVYKYAIEYLGVALIGLPLQFVFVLNNSALRALNAPTQSLKVSVVANMLNVVFDPVFMFLVGWGIAGAAVATIVSVGVGIVVQWVALVRREMNLNFASFSLAKMRELIVKGIFATFQLFFRISSMLALIKIISLLSQVAISSYGIVIRVYQILLFMVFGFANASFVVVGQNLGFGRVDRSIKGTYVAMFIATTLITVLDVILMLNAGSVVRVFTVDPRVVYIAKRIILFIGLSYPFIVMNTIAARSSMALHDTMRPSIINLVNLWIFQVPLAYYLSLRIGLTGVWLSIAISNFTGFLMNFVVLKWNFRRVIENPPVVRVQRKRGPGVLPPGV